MVKIGNVEINGKVVVAPMAGITNKTYRMICKEFGAALVVGEMVSDKAVMFGNEKTKKLLDMDESERPISQQIFGSDKESFCIAAKKVYEYMHPDIIDINMGCPAPKVVKNGDGSKLLLDLEKAKKIMQSVVENSSVPVTIKIRKGWDNDHIVAVDVAKIAQEVGISAITIHGRTRSEFYTGNADWEIIKQVKQNVDIPVIGNGDVIDEETALKMFQTTGVDGIMIGRGALGNPWIFREIEYFLKTGKKLEPPTKEERLQTIKQHIELAVQEKGDIAIKELRKHISWYTKNMPNSTNFRSSINKIESKEELINKIDEYFT